LDIKFRISETLLFCCLWALGCTDDSTSPERDPCDDPSQLYIRSPAGVEKDPDHVASLSLDELAIIDENGKEEKSGMIKAVFADVSELVEDTTPVIAFGPSCVARVGDPEESEGSAPMQVDKVAFTSEVFGELSLEPDEEGRFDPLLEDSFFSRKGGETVAVTVDSNNGESSFPGFSTKIVVPEAVEMETTTIEEKLDTSLEIGWVPSDASFLEIKLRTEPPPNTSLPPNRIRCFFLEDDGCFLVPAAAMESLTSQGVYDITVRIERHSFEFAVASETALAEIDAIRSIEFNIHVE
jgi:hypothetical protein